VAHPISERSEKAVRALFAHAAARPDAPTYLVDQLVEAELHRRGQPDASGAFHVLALTQGSLLKEEFDLSTHGHADGWVMGALLVDPLEFMLFNQRYGFKAGDRAISALVSALQRLVPKGKVARLHTDGFALLLGPTAERAVDEALVTEAGTRLSAAIAEVTPPDDEVLPRAVAFTVGALELTVVDPPTWQLLGPLVWAECERALVVARRGGIRTVQRRRIELQGRLPAFGE
jgi:GGDEF domain-containing protein